ncbi:MAG: AAA family ATPase [Alphaproteobacteria bacterium]|nr:AAA family ATPase [Alphaproteobacteria bacterium]
MADNEQNINKEPATNATDSVKTQLNDNQQNVLVQDKNAGMPDKTTDALKYRIVTMRELMATELPKREWIVFPFIPEKSVCMLYASRGLGKTFVGLTIALGVASGKNVMNFDITKTHRVVYIDGEMSAVELKERLNALATGLGIGDGANDNLQILTSDLQPMPLPNLGIPDGQKSIMNMLVKADLIILDNLSVLCSYGRENEAESWAPMQRWLIDLKRRGKSVLIIDHAGKNGDNRGTSKKQDMVDSVLKLRTPGNHNPKDGASFIMVFDKSRGICGDAVADCEARLVDNPNGDGLIWQISDHVPRAMQKKSQDFDMQRQAQELKQQGKTVREIGDILGCSKTKAAELAKEPTPPYNNPENHEPVSAFPTKNVEQLEKDRMMQTLKDNPYLGG